MIAGGAVNDEGIVEAGLNSIVKIFIHIFPKRSSRLSNFFEELLALGTGKRPAAFLQTIAEHLHLVFLEIGRKPRKEVQSRNVGGMEVRLWIGLAERKDAGIGGGLLEHGQVAKIKNGMNPVLLNESAQWFAIPCAHPLVGCDETKDTALPQDTHAKFRLLMRVALRMEGTNQRTRGDALQF